MLQNFQSSFAARVLKWHLVNAESMEFTGAEAVNRLGYVRDKSASFASW